MHAIIQWTAMTPPNIPSTSSADSFRATYMGAREPGTTPKFEEACTSTLASPPQRAHAPVDSRPLDALYT